MLDREPHDGLRRRRSAPPPAARGCARGRPAPAHAPRSRAPADPAPVPAERPRGRPRRVGLDVRHPRRHPGLAQRQPAARRARRPATPRAARPRGAGRRTCRAARGRTSSRGRPRASDAPPAGRAPPAVELVRQLEFERARGHRAGSLACGRFTDRSRASRSIAPSSLEMAHFDLHLHLLPGVDDGPADEAASLVHAERMARAGVHEATVTPHVGHPDFPTRRRHDPRADARAAGRDRRGGHRPAPAPGRRDLPARRGRARPRRARRHRPRAARLALGAARGAVRRDRPRSSRHATTCEATDSAC